MLTLDSPITLTPKAINSPNLCDMFEPADLERIGTECYQGYLADEQSRADQVADLILAKPSIVKRPVVEWPDGRLTIGFKAGEFLEVTP